MYEAYSGWDCGVRLFGSLVPMKMTSDRPACQNIWDCQALNFVVTF